MREFKRAIKKTAFVKKYTCIRKKVLPFTVQNPQNISPLEQMCSAVARLK